MQGSQPTHTFVTDELDYTKAATDSKLFSGKRLGTAEQGKLQFIKPGTPEEVLAKMAIAMKHLDASVTRQRKATGTLFRATFGEGAKVPKCVVLSLSKKDDDRDDA